MEQGCKRPRARLLPLAALGLLLPFAGGVARAADWRVTPAIDAGALRDDNIRLAPGPHETTTGYIAAANLDVERQSPTSDAEFEAAVVHTDYSEGEVEDRTDQRARLTARKRTSERSTFGLRGEYRRDTLFENVVLEEGTGDTQDVDVGLSTETEVRRNYRVIEPSWSWLLSELSSVDFAYRRGDVNFTGPAGAGLVDYETDQLNATYNRRVSARNSVHVTAGAARYRPADENRKAETLQLLVGMGREFSETLRGSFAIGASRTDEDGGAGDSSSGLVVRAELRQEAEVSTLHAIASRDVAPSGIGRALQTDQVRLYWVRPLSPTVEFALDARWLQTEVVEGFDPQANRRYYEVSPRLSWRWLANLSVVASYRQRYQKYETADSADSSTVFLGLSYAL